jgi:hypothetical protein
LAGKSLAGERVEHKPVHSLSQLLDLLEAERETEDIGALTPLDPQEVMKIHYFEYSPVTGDIMINLRLRTDQSWLFFRNISVKLGQNVVVSDDQESDNVVGVPSAYVERLSRTDIMTDEHG